MDDNTTWLQRLRRRVTRGEIIGFFVIWLLLAALTFWAAHSRPAEEAPIILHNNQGVA